MSALLPPQTDVHMRYLECGILEAKAACRAFVLGEWGTTTAGVDEGWLRALGELKERDTGLGGGTGTGVLGGTEGPAGLGEGPKKLNPLGPGLTGEGAPQGEVTE